MRNIFIIIFSCFSFQVMIAKNCNDRCGILQTFFNSELAYKELNLDICSEQITILDPKHFFDTCYFEIKHFEIKVRHDSTAENRFLQWNISIEKFNYKRGIYTVLIFYPYKGTYGPVKFKRRKKAGEFYIVDSKLVLV